MKLVILIYRVSTNFFSIVEYDYFKIIREITQK